VGKPILHSASPQMHNAAFEKLAVNAVYFRLAAASAKEALETAGQMGLSGMNVTAPFKEEMEKLADGLDGNAKAIGAVNTVVFGKGARAQGFNTDSAGVSRSLEENGAILQGAKAVVLGAGGAAKAAVHALISHGARVTVANRTVEKAKLVAAAFGCAFCPLENDGLERALADADILVSTISTGRRVVRQDLLHEKLAVLDAVYSKKTALSIDAQAAGCKVIGGTEWLAHQGAEAFMLFTGKRIDSRVMRRAVESGGRNARGRTNIALVGFMGSGKTETAKEISKLGGRKLVEIDSRIAEAAGMGIREIFGKHGESHFRKLESAAIASLSRAKNCIVSCGGGAVLDERNAAILRKNCVVVWLWATPEEIVKRIGRDSSRPLMDRKDKLHAAREILAGRMKLYASACDFAVSTEGRSAEEVARLILGEIGAANAKARARAAK
ncbi:MAG: shikimate kinase, partial [Candidatus Anstonellaceae archaeon]